MHEKESGDSTSKLPQRRTQYVTLQVEKPRDGERFHAGMRQTSRLANGQPDAINNHSRRSAPQGAAMQELRLPSSASRGQNSP